jgi:hypothetical protein
MKQEAVKGRFELPDRDTARSFHGARIDVRCTDHCAYQREQYRRRLPEANTAHAERITTGTLDGTVAACAEDLRYPGHRSG